MKKNIDTTNEGEIILYQPDNNVRLEVRMHEETVWLNRQQMAILFTRDIKTIGKHINNALQEELSDFPVVAKFATTARDGKTYQVEHYNLDMILSVGYRVKSKRGVEFRKWANSVLKEYLLRGYAINQRFEHLEQRVSKTEELIGLFVHTALPPAEGVFYDGQIFDAYTFVADLIRSARERIILIDNYVDDSVLKVLTKRNEGVNATVVTRRISEALAVDIERHNQQYPSVNIQTSDRFHDRFIILDDTVYHLGASMKDLGKRLFAFSKLNIPAEKIL